jgi:hypothetical protein
MSDTTVSRELHLCHTHYGWSLQTIKEIIIAGFKSAFMPYREKADLLAEISAELATVRPPQNGKELTRPAPVESQRPAPEAPAEPIPSTEIQRP